MKTLRALFRDRRFSIGAVIMLVLIVLAFLSFFSPYDPTEWRVVPRDLPPSRGALAGDELAGPGRVLAADRRHPQFPPAGDCRRVHLQGHRADGRPGVRLQRGLHRSGAHVRQRWLPRAAAAADPVLLAMMLQEQLSLLDHGRALRGDGLGVRRPLHPVANPEPAGAGVHLYRHPLRERLRSS